MTFLSRENTALHKTFFQKTTTPFNGRKTNTQTFCPFKIDKLTPPVFPGKPGGPSLPYKVIPIKNTNNIVLI